MPTIETRNSGPNTSYRARVRVKGFPEITATFIRKTDAKRWAADIEAKIRSGRYFPETHHTLSDAIRRYSDHHLCELKDAAKRSQHLTWWCNQIGHMRLVDIRSGTISKYRAILQEEPSNFGRHKGRFRSNATVNRYMASLSAMFSYAVNEWEWVEKNPCSKIKKLRENRGRTRFLSKNELSSLLSSCRKETDHPELEVIVLIAVTTGMRRGEILKLRQSDIDRKRGRIIIRDSKNRESRSVALVSNVLSALNALNTVTSIRRDALLFPQRGADSEKPLVIDRLSAKAIKRAGLIDFSFHDLRHTAASYLAMEGAGLIEIADIIGHKTLEMVKRYSHLTEDHKHQTVSRMADSVLEGI
jgi:integrase